MSNSREGTMSTFYVQVQSSSQFLNILDGSMANGAEACQGINKSTNNFNWGITPAGEASFFFQVASSKQFLNIYNASTANGAMACQGSSNTTPNFFWKFVVLASSIPAPNTDFYLKVKSSGQYLNILNSSKENGAPACQGMNSTTDNFLWQLISAPNGNFFLQNKSSSQYLNILNSSKENGALACQGTNNTTNNFQWEIIPLLAEPGYFYLQNVHSRWYLNILNGSTANGAIACQGDQNPTDNFLWQFVTPINSIPSPGTPFYLKVQSSGQYLNILNGSNQNGALACQGTNNTTDNFIWTLTEV
jgi:hypothetical protein